MTVGAMAALPWCLGLSSFVKRFFVPKPTQPLLLSSFKIYRSITDDRWNKKPGSEYYCVILAKETDPQARAGIKEIGHFKYRASVGQVNTIYLHPDYRDRLLREQILVYMMKDMLDHGATHIWEGYPERNLMYHETHPYFGLWDFEYKCKDVHPGVTGTGYSMPIPKDPRELVVEHREPI